MADASTSSRRNRFKVKRVDTAYNAADDDGDDSEVNSQLSTSTQTRTHCSHLISHLQQISNLLNRLKYSQESQQKNKQMLRKY